MYQTEFDGTDHEFGTSGFVYRSNTLLYDQATKSLWSTLKGEPVVGPLVGQGISLKRLSCVTSTWGQWKKDHPDTSVLSLDTGYERDYDEGAAYGQYLATDELVFSTPLSDERLKNKAEVLVFHGKDDQLAIAADFLMENSVYHEKIGDVDFVVLTDRSGANRAYATGGKKFKSWDQDQTAVDEQGVKWSLTESALSNSDSESLERVSAHRAFWFGWHAQFENTRLVK